MGEHDVAGLRGPAEVHDDLLERVDCAGERVTWSHGAGQRVARRFASGRTPVSGGASSLDGGPPDTPRGLLQAPPALVGRPRRREVRPGPAPKLLGGSNRRGGQMHRASQRLEHPERTTLGVGAIAQLRDRVQQPGEQRCRRLIVGDRR